LQLGNPVTLIAELKDAVIEVHGHTHNLALVMSRAGSCPLIDVKLQDLDMDTLFQSSPVDIGVDNLSPVVYKHSGKMLIIVGRNHVLKAQDKKHATIEARLLTSVALKSARIVEASTVPSTPVLNTPRIIDQRRNTASAGPSHERTRTADHIRNDAGRPQHSTPRPFTGEPRPSFSKPSSPKKRFA
jgi:hypothetical protein